MNNSHIKLNRFIDALLPSACALCGSGGLLLLCSACRQQFFAQSISRCQQCALPISVSSQATHCGECLKTPPAFDLTVAACNYAAPLDQIVLALKFGHRLALAPLFSSVMRDAVLHAADQALPELLTVVPLGSRRLRDRGFNQAAEIAKPLSAHLGIPLHLTLIARTKETVQQTSLHPDERHKNMRNAFVINEIDLKQIEGKHIAVVDDVMTTGTTLNEIAKLLKRFGASKVSNFIFARTVPH